MWRQKRLKNEEEEKKKKRKMDVETIDKYASMTRKM